MGCSACEQKISHSINKFIQDRMNNYRAKKRRVRISVRPPKPSFVCLAEGKINMINNFQARLNVQM